MKSVHQSRVAGTQVLAKVLLLPICLTILMWFVVPAEPVVGVCNIVGTTPATRKSVDLNCLVAVWVTEFSDQLSEQADRITNGPAQLERAFSALDTRLINAEKRNDQTIDRNTARILAIETASAAASSVTGSSVPSDPGSSPAGSTSTGTQGQRRNLVDNERVVPSAWCSPGPSLRRRAQSVLASLVPSGRLVWPHGFAGLSLRTTILK